MYGLRFFFPLDENSLNVPTTDNLNRTFLLVHYPFFNILKLVLRKVVLYYIYTRDPHRHWYFYASAMTSLLQSYD